MTKIQFLIPARVHRSSGKVFLRYILAAVSVGVAVGAAPLSAQDIPVNSEAELVFDEAVKAFEAGDYETALRRFRLVKEAYPLNRMTTAAWLMAAKSAYRTGDYERASFDAETFLDRFPRSSYVEEMEIVRGYAREATERGGAFAEITEIGVLLPVEDADIPLTQSMFNGVRIAVDEYNRSGERGRRVRMVFRESSPNEQAQRDTIRALSARGVAAIIGPLYSDEAIRAAAAAEDERVVLIAPLATDDEVADDRQFVFQANPTVTMRGRLMARFAVGNLRLTELGVIAERDDGLSERMAEGFEDELMRLGGTLKFVHMLPNTTAWFRLSDRIEPDTLLSVEAIYLPVTGGDATTLIKGALDGFDRMRREVRILGNKEWHNLPSRTQASKYNTIYTNDFYVDEANTTVQQFEIDYQQIAGEPPGQVAYVGYDVARYLLYLLSSQEGPLDEIIRRAPPYQGLATRFDFRGGNVNQAMYYMRYRAGQVELLR